MESEYVHTKYRTWFRDMADDYPNPTDIVTRIYRGNSSVQILWNYLKDLLFSCLATSSKCRSIILLIARHTSDKWTFQDFFSYPKIKNWQLFKCLQVFILFFYNQKCAAIWKLEFECIKMVEIAVIFSPFKNRLLYSIPTDCTVYNQWGQWYKLMIIHKMEVSNCHRFS